MQHMKVYKQFVHLLQILFCLLNLFLNCAEKKNWIILHKVGVMA